MRAVARKARAGARKKVGVGGGRGAGATEERLRSARGKKLGSAGAEEFAEVGDGEGYGAAFGGEDEAFFDEAVSGWGEGVGFAVEGGGYFGGRHGAVVGGYA